MILEYTEHIPIKYAICMYNKAIISDSAVVSPCNYSCDL